MLKLTFVGKDGLGIPVYRDQNGKLWKDINLGKGIPDLYDSADNEMDGDPYRPIGTEFKFLVQYTPDVNEFDYMMLYRLSNDCDYYLGYGRRSAKWVQGENGIETIAEMKRIWNSLPADGKPTWLSMEDIEEYESEMRTPSGRYNDPYSWGEHRRRKRYAAV